MAQRDDSVPLRRQQESTPTGWSTQDGNLLMNLLESQLQYPLEDVMPDGGTTMEIVPGVRWIRMPLPFALDHINLWLLRDKFEGREGWTIVDCGIARKEVKAFWETIFENELEGLPVLRVVVTHMHPDHVGLSHWLCQRFDAPLFMTITDYTMARLFSEGGAQGGATGGERAVAFFGKHGINDPDSMTQLLERKTYYSDLVPAMPDHFTRIADNDVLRIGGRDWQVIIGQGHAPEHASLYCAELNIFIAGDMVLPRISTNVSVSDLEPNADPLKLYLESLDKYTFMPEDTLVLPSHGKPFLGLHVRIQQQREHHAARLAEVMEACVTPQSAADIVPIMFTRKLDLHQMTFALGEALAHLHTLFYQGRLCRQVDGEGVIRFSRVSG